MTSRSRADEAERMRDACAGIAAALANAVDRSADRLTDYDRGELAAARHIERRIRELKLAGGSGQQAASAGPSGNSASCTLPAASSKADQ